MDISKYKTLYLQETSGHLSGVEKGLLSIEKGYDAAAVDELFRHYHSIKGMSASMGYEPLKKLAHSQENLLDGIRSKRIDLTPEIVSTLLQCLDAMRALLERVENDLPLDADISGLLEMLISAGKGEPINPRTQRQSETAPVQAKTPEKSHELKLSNVMTVEGRVFDDLLSIVGDLLGSLSTFKSLTHASRSIAFKDGVHTLGRSVDALYSNILAARMLPIKDLTEGLPRIIRDMCIASGKEIELKIEGSEISLDRSVLQSLAGPMVHIIRNSVDHGIETPDDRINNAKGPTGQIRITAYSKKDRAVIEVTDDGRGIDIERLKIEALARGASRDKIISMTGKEALMLICMPGLSTATVVTETSGRGVGMDAVKDVIEGLGGTLEISSTPGAGTKITMELPRSTAIIKALAVNVGTEVFLIPISRVEHVLEVSARLAGSGSMEYEDGQIEIRSLAAALGMDETASPARQASTVIVVRSARDERDSRLIGFAVDDFGEEIDAYIRPLLPPMSRLRGVMGITIIGEARPAFLLDMAQLTSKPTERT
ncbi:MAG: ATP-binding protein [Deltaproteobacteria bacterium]|mgnify:FL=1